MRLMKLFGSVSLVLTVAGALADLGRRDTAASPEDVAAAAGVVSDLLGEAPQHADPAKRGTGKTSLRQVVSDLLAP